MKISKKAFTLMEMLVVMGIIGILLIIVIPTVSTVLHNRNKKLYNTHKLTVEAAAEVYVDQYKGQLTEKDRECYNIDYSLLLNENLKETDIHCEENVIFRRSSSNSKVFNPEYYLKCTDSNGDIVHDDGRKPTGCLGFNGKFDNISVNIYTDNSHTNIYDGTYYVKNAYIVFNSNSPYNSPISHYEYATSLDGNWEKIANNVNLGTVDKLKNYVGYVYFRSVDEDGNISSNIEKYIKMDNTGPSFSTSVAGSYLVKKVNIYDVSDPGIGTLADDAYSFDGGNTWVKDMVSEYIENKTIQVCSRDKLDNRTCKSVEISGIDRVAPTIVAKSSKVYINQGDSNNIADYFNITYSPLGGNVSCTVSNTSSLAFGINTVTCTATGVNTLQASASIIIAHQYSATANCSGGRTLSNGQCIYSYTNNEAKCGCAAWRSCQNLACGTTNRTCRTASCGVESYKSCQSSACGTHNLTCRTAACGVESYKLCTTSACGTTNKSCETSACGVASYNICQNEAACGCDVYSCTLDKKCTKCTCSGTNWAATYNCNQTNYSYDCRSNQSGGSGTPSFSTGRYSGCGTETVTGSDCNNADSKYCSTAASCRTSACGVEKYNQCQNAACGTDTNTCRTESCGVESYNQCQHADCGVENNTCRTESCGVESYNQCQHADCGYDINTCATKECGCQQANSCTKTENEYRYYTCDRTGNNGTNGSIDSSTGLCKF